MTGRKGHPIDVPVHCPHTTQDATIQRESPELVKHDKVDAEESIPSSPPALPLPPPPPELYVVQIIPYLNWKYSHKTQGEI